MRLQHVAAAFQGGFQEATDHAVHEYDSVPSAAGAEGQGAGVLRQAGQQAFTCTGAL